MAQQEGYVQLSEPAEVVERLPAASHVTFEPPSNFGATPQYPTAAAAQSAPGTSYPNVGPQPPPPAHNYQDAYDDGFGNDEPPEWTDDLLPPGAPPP